MVLQHMWEIADAFPVFFHVLFLPFICFFLFSFCLNFSCPSLSAKSKRRNQGRPFCQLKEKDVFFLHCSQTARQLWIDHGPFPEMAHVPLKKARQCQVHKYNKQQDPKRSKGAFYLPVQVYVALKLWIVFPLEETSTLTDMLRWNHHVSNNLCERWTGLEYIQFLSLRAIFWRYDTPTH